MLRHRQTRAIYIDGFHRCKALEQAGMLEVRADVYEMALTDASRYRREHRNAPDLPIPGKLVDPHPAETEKAETEQAPAATPDKPSEDEIPNRI